MDRPYYLSLLAEAQYHAGHLKNALGTLDDALALVAKAGAPFVFEAELLRMRGMFDGEPSRAETLVRQAIALFTRQETRSLQLRATVSLAQLPGSDGGEARRLLAAIVSEFSEGANTVDLREARAMLEGTEPTGAPTARTRRRRS